MRPDGRQAIVAVIGDPKVERDGKLVEINIDPQAGKFELGRSLVIAEDPVFKEKADKFKDIGAVCQQYTADGKQAYVTLGPAIANGGLVVLDTGELQTRRRLSGGRAQGELRYGANAGWQAHVRQWRRPWRRGLVRDRRCDQEGRSSGLKSWRGCARDLDHADGREVWMVNRVTSNAIVIDPNSFAVVAEIADVGNTPDIVAMSPDSKFAFITTRGPIRYRCRTLPRARRRASASSRSPIAKCCVTFSRRPATRRATSTASA